jgi:hypothetical protein
MKTLRRACVALGAALLLGASLVAQPAQAATATVAADFATNTDYPLIKSKFGVFNSGYVSLARWQRDAPRLATLRPARVRWEMMWGNEQHDWAPMVTGTAANPQYNFSQVDQLVDLINGAGALPVPALTYTPSILKPPGGSWNNPPTNPLGLGEPDRAGVREPLEADRPADRLVRDLERTRPARRLLDR